MSHVPPKEYSHLFLCLEASRQSPEATAERRDTAERSISGIVRRHPSLGAFVTLYDTDRDEAIKIYEQKLKDWLARRASRRLGDEGARRLKLTKDPRRRILRR